MQPIMDPARHGILKGNFNVIKLHGSFNWRTMDGRNSMVVGTGKEDQINAYPLLSWYWDIFKSVLSAGNVRLLIVGYGFGDDHVNATIADAVEHHGLRVFIWDISLHLSDLVRKAPHGTSIWKGLLSTSTRPLIKVFPGNQGVTEEYQRILKTIFD